LAFAALCGLWQQPPIPDDRTPFASSCPSNIALIESEVSDKKLAATGDAMPIPTELLEILVCPLCKTPVKPLTDHTGLKCLTCRRVYPVVDDIPVMLIEEAAIAPE
jgi:uncharacterized protein YbaR (Trm112 family)